jgi:hypothetical protein
LLRHRAERDVSAWLVILMGGVLGIAAHVTHKIGSVPLGLSYPPVTGTVPLGQCTLRGGSHRP